MNFNICLVALAKSTVKFSSTSTQTSLLNSRNIAAFHSNVERELQHLEDLDIIAKVDFLSRHPNNIYTPPAENTTEAYVNYLCNNLIPKAMTIDEVQQETANDPVLCKLSEAIPHNKWLDPEVKLDLEKKEKMKDADKRQHSKTNDLKVGDTVLIRQPKKNKLSPLFDPKPFKVEARKGTMVTAKRGSHTITRNISFFKKISGLQDDTSADEDESDDDDIPMTSNQTRQEEDCQEPARPRRSERNRRQPKRFGF